MVRSPACARRCARLVPVLSVVDRCLGRGACVLGVPTVPSCGGASPPRAESTTLRERARRPRRLVQVDSREQSSRLATLCGRRQQRARSPLRRVSSATRRVRRRSAARTVGSARCTVGRALVLLDSATRASQLRKESSQLIIATGALRMLTGTLCIVLDAVRAAAMPPHRRVKSTSAAVQLASAHHHGRLRPKRRRLRRTSPIRHGPQIAHSSISRRLDV